MGSNKSRPAGVLVENREQLTAAVELNGELNALQAAAGIRATRAKRLELHEKLAEAKAKTASFLVRLLSQVGDEQSADVLAHAGEELIFAIEQYKELAGPQGRRETSISFQRGTAAQPRVGRTRKRLSELHSTLAEANTRLNLPPDALLLFLRELRRTERWRPQSSRGNRDLSKERGEALEDMAGELPQTRLRKVWQLRQHLEAAEVAAKRATELATKLPHRTPDYARQLLAHDVARVLRDRLGIEPTLTRDGLDRTAGKRGGGAYVRVLRVALVLAGDRRARQVSHDLLPVMQSGLELLADPRGDSIK